MFLNFQIFFVIGCFSLGRVWCQTENGTYLPVESGFGCGARLSSGFILGGEDAKRGEFPFIATLGYSTNSMPILVFRDIQTDGLHDGMMYSRLSRCSKSRGLVLGSPGLVPPRLRLLSLFYFQKFPMY